MAQQTLKVRTKLRYHDLDHWNSNNPVLYAGELGIATDGNEVFLKVGNGTQRYRDLPVLSAQALDVKDWAKADTKPRYKASEIEGLDELLGDKDTNTKYRIIPGAENGQFILQSKELDDTNWTNDYTLTIPDAITYTMSSNQAGEITVTPSKGDIQKIVVVQITQDIEAGSSKIPTAGAVVNYVSEEMSKLGVSDINDLVFNTPYDKVTNKAATMKDVDTSKEAIFGALDDKQDKITASNKLPSSLVSGTATSSSDGLMSKEDKAKLDEIQSGGSSDGIEKIMAGDDELPVTDKTVALAKIAETGNVNDLVQNEGDVLILEGGSSLGLPPESGVLILNGTI